MLLCMYFCSQLIATRKIHKEAFLKKHGVKLGFMSAFVKAASFALADQPVVNAGEILNWLCIVRYLYSGLPYDNPLICKLSIIFNLCLWHYKWASDWPMLTPFWQA